MAPPLGPPFSNREEIVETNALREPVILIVQGFGNRLNALMNSSAKIGPTGPVLGPAGTFQPAIGVGVGATSRLTALLGSTGAGASAPVDWVLRLIGN